MAQAENSPQAILILFLISVVSLTSTIIEVWFWSLHNMQTKPAFLNHANQLFVSVSDEWNEQKNKQWLQAGSRGKQIWKTFSYGNTKSFEQ
jgi:hypothetical protein